MVVQGDEAEEEARAIEAVVPHRQMAGGVALVVEEQAVGVVRQAAVQVAVRQARHVGERA